MFNLGGSLAIKKRAASNPVWLQALLPRRLMLAEPFPILLTKEQRECLRSHAQKSSLALQALESSSEIDPKFLAAVANGGAEVEISYEAASAAELKALARVHCPSAVQAIEKAIKYNQDFRAAEPSKKT